MTLGIAAVVEASFETPSGLLVTRRVQFVQVVLAASGMGVEIDIPLAAARIFPRVTMAGANVPVALADLEVYGGAWA